MSDSEVPGPPGPAEDPSGTGEWPSERVDGVEEPAAPSAYDAPAEPDVEPAVESAARGRRLPLVLATLAAVLVLGAALAAPLVDRAFRGDEQAQRALDLSLVKTYDIPDRKHTRGQVDYPQNPPVGGRHNPVWLACGVYGSPVHDENAVHDLEHGTVWITHAPSLSEEDVATLAAQLPDNGIMSPRGGLPSPVVVTVWGAQLELDGADDPRLGIFLEEYGDGHTAPEFGASCRGGRPDPSGAVPEVGTNA